jgi:hypothetical protein
MGGAVVTAVSWKHALAWRMQHHLVERAEPAELVRIVSDICGLHAQVMSSAKHSVWARSSGHDQRAPAGAPSRNPLAAAGSGQALGCSRHAVLAPGNGNGPLAVSPRHHAEVREHRRARQTRRGPSVMHSRAGS